MIHIDPKEKLIIVASSALLIVFAVIVGLSAFAYGVQLPAPEQRVDPQTVITPGVSRFGDPLEDRVRELAPNKFEVYMVARAWSFSPNRIEVPAGSTVTFYLTSIDVVHGFQIERTNVNMMVLPGEVSKLTATFDTPGVYNFICHEYCGVGHHTMYGTITVRR